ncbi:RNA-binding protein [Streptomyces albus subsp. albus]|nr:RNA-binding protein [Streptomyces albus subsp. albus]
MSGTERTSVLDEGEQVTVRLVKHPRPDVRYPAQVTADDGTRIVVRAPWAKADARDFGFVRFEPGDVFTEHYWRDRWYSVKAVRTGEGALKGWYCDITRPTEVVPGGLVVTDLELDLWVSADERTILRLDEDEFLESGLPERDPAAAEQARRALDELELLAREGGFGRLTA